MDTKWGKQVALHEGDIDINTPLMSMVLDEQNITLDSNQNIEITANEVLNLGRSVFTYTDSNGSVQTKIEETQSITIETEELCTVSVTSFGTVIELDEDNFMMPQDKVKMEGSVKDGFADISSQGQQSGDNAKKSADEAKKKAEEERLAKEKADAKQAELDARKEKGEEKKKKGGIFRAIGAAVAVVAVVVAVVAVAVFSAPLVAVGAAIVAVGAVGTALLGQGSIEDGKEEIRLAEAGITETEQQVEINGYTEAGNFLIGASAAMATGYFLAIGGWALIPAGFTGYATYSSAKGPENAFNNLSLMLSISPAGDAKDLQEAITGVDAITGIGLSGTDRLLSCVGILPLIPNFRHLNKFNEIDDVFKHGDDVLTNSKKLDIGDFTDEIIKTKPMYSVSPKRWYKDGGKIEILENGEWNYINKNGENVIYTGNYADFSKYYNNNYDVVSKDEIFGNGYKLTGDQAADKRTMEKFFSEVKYVDPNEYAGYTWHHLENGDMVLVRSDIHYEFKHLGDAAKYRNGELP